MVNYRQMFLNNSQDYLLSSGASILIILGVSLAIGLTVLLFGLYYMKRLVIALDFNIFLKAFFL